MSRCSAELRGHYAGSCRSISEEHPTQSMMSEIITDKKLKLRRKGKCKKCKNFGYPEWIVEEMREVWNKKFKPKRKDYICLLNSNQWSRAVHILIK